jgi:DNA-binding protein HU-beta
MTVFAVQRSQHEIALGDQMTKAELIAKIADQSGTSKTQAEGALNTLLDIIKTELAADSKVTFTGFGTFSVSERSARTGRNPQTGNEIKIPACKVAKFKAGKALKEAVK